MHTALENFQASRENDTPAYKYDYKSAHRTGVNGC
jgi:hypothetical protein